MTLQNEPTHIHGPENSKSKNVGSVGDLTECTYTYTASGPENSKFKNVGSVDDFTE